MASPLEFGSLLNVDRKAKRKFLYLAAVHLVAEFIESNPRNGSSFNMISATHVLQYTSITYFLKNLKNPATHESCCFLA